MHSDTAARELPYELVLRLLGHVGLQQRLASCSRVSKAWRGAAAAATSDITFSTNRYPGIPGLFVLQQWLCAHGSCVKQLSVLHSSSAHVQLQLPLTKLPHLQQLTVHGCQLQEHPCDSSGGSSSHGRHHPLHAQHQLAQTGAGSSAQHSASGNLAAGSSQLSLASLSSLTALELQDVNYALADEVASLSVLTQLQRLSLCNVAMRLSRGGPLAQQQLHWLSPLTGLTRLDIPAYLLPRGVEGPLSILQQLQQLHCSAGDDCGRVDTTGAMLSGLPPSLTKMQLIWDADEDFSSSTVPAMCGLTALQELSFECWRSDVAIVPDFCSSMGQLRVLSMATGDVNRTGAALATVLPRLLQLEDLRMTTDEECSPLEMSDVDKLGALLPQCSHLTRLELAWPPCSPSWSMLPVDAARRLVAGGQQLLQLKQLVLGLASGNDELRESPSYLAEDVSDMPACFGSGDISRLVRCCPALEQLHIAGLVPPAVDMSPLLQLIALTGLVVGGEVVDDDVARSVLAQLSGLRRLEVYAAPKLTHSGLLALAALKQLRHLIAGDQFAGEYFDISVPTKDGWVVLTCEPEDAVPSVWAKLASICLQSDDEDCRRRAVNLLSAPQGFQQLQEQLGVAQAQQAATEAHAVELAQQLATAQAQAKSLEQQLAAAQAKLAAVRKEKQAMAC